jgi:hypothetical protein
VRGLLMRFSGALWLFGCGFALASLCAHADTLGPSPPLNSPSDQAAPSISGSEFRGPIEEPAKAAPAAGSTAPDRAQPAEPNSGKVDGVCQTIDSAAVANGLPREFLTRLIWQESRFNTHALSHAGAQGIAQFMPSTAHWVGLDNPFDATEAIGKSASLLDSLRKQFGNLGLAAAAYNAGPKRVADWLSRRRSLPAETRAYVQIVTGHAASEWEAIDLSANASAGPTLASAIPCTEIVRLFAEGGGTISPRPQLSGHPVATTTPSLAWGVQLIGESSQTAALASFSRLQRTYRSVLGSAEPLVIRTPVGANGSWYRVRIGANTLGDAERLCSSLRAAGGNCLVQRN